MRPDRWPIRSRRWRSAFRRSVAPVPSCSCRDGRGHADATARTPDRSARRSCAAVRSPSFRNSRRRQTGRRAGVGLRLVAIGHRGIEDMRAETGFGDVAGLRGPRSGTARAASRRPRRHCENRRPVRRGPGRRRMPPCPSLGHGRAAGSPGIVSPACVPSAIEHVQPDRQVGLHRGHRRRLEHGAKAQSRQDRERQQVAAAHLAGQRWECRGRCADCRARRSRGRCGRGRSASPRSAAARHAGRRGFPPAPASADRAGSPRRPAPRWRTGRPRGSSVTGCSAPMRSSAMVPAGIGTAWLFCSHSTTFSSGRGAGRPAKRSDGQALASCVQDNEAPLSDA